jgi:hypothetical protein
MTAERPDMPDVEFPMGFRRCPRCKAANYGRIAKCLRCGSELPFEPTRKERSAVPERKTGWIPARFCHRCGKPVPQDHMTKYCRHCGQPIVMATDGSA